MGIIVDMTQPDDIAPETPAWSGEDLSKNPHTVTDKAKKVEAMFTSIARTYDFNNRIHSMWRDQAWRNRVVSKARISIDDKVVDVACGTGDLSMAFYRAGVRSVLGIDFTQAMLDLAVAKAIKSGANIKYEQGDAMNLQVEDASVDVVSIAFGIRNVQQPAKAIAEFYRILKPGGRLLVLEFSTPPNMCIRFLNNIYTKYLMPLTATLIAKDTSGAYKYLPKSVESFAEPKELASLIENTGFCDVEHESQTFGVCTITKALKP